MKRVLLDLTDDWELDVLRLDLNELPPTIKKTILIDTVEEIDEEENIRCPKYVVEIDDEDIDEDIQCSEYVEKREKIKKKNSKNFKIGTKKSLLPYNWKIIKNNPASYMLHNYSYMTIRDAAFLILARENTPMRASRINRLCRKERFKSIESVSSKSLENYLKMEVKTRLSRFAYDDECFSLSSYAVKMLKRKYKQRNSLSLSEEDYYYTHEGYSSEDDYQEIKVQKNIIKQKHGNKHYQIMLDLFWTFAYRRHKLWDYKYGSKKQIDFVDITLSQHKFCNVYRELDMGTIYFHQMSKEYSDVSTLLEMSLHYRLLNRMSTFQTFEKRNRNRGIPLGSKQVSLFIKYLKEQLQENIPIFTHKHQHCGFQQYIETISKKKEWGFKKVVSDIENNKSDAKSILKILNRIPQVGAFLSQQIANDMRENGVLSYDLNSFCLLGTGAKSGIELIFKSKKHLENIKWLQKNQLSEFERLSLDFPYHPKYKTLSISNIEHSLCEFFRYFKRCKK